VTLRKLKGPAISADNLGSFDYVLLSHDHHFDNLDHAGRKILSRAKSVLTTDEGSQRLGGNSIGMKPWDSVDLAVSDERVLKAVAAPARHGPEGLHRGSVIGFVLYFADAPDDCIYFGGDTVWYDGVAEVGRRFPIKLAILNIGAARVPEVGPFHLTMTAEEAVETARAFTDATIVPLHFEGWAHFSEGRPQIADAFARAHLTNRLIWPEAGQRYTFRQQPGARS
jgi:L-ascorbate metabolism protein UlaG (beta-lactamase superfamily)